MKKYLNLSWLLAQTTKWKLRTIRVQSTNTALVLTSFWWLEHLGLLPRLQSQSQLGFPDSPDENPGWNFRPWVHLTQPWRPGCWKQEFFLLLFTACVYYSAGLHFCLMHFVASWMITWKTGVSTIAPWILTSSCILLVKDNKLTVLMDFKKWYDVSANTTCLQVSSVE